MIFTGEDIRRYKEHGWVAVREFWSAEEVRAMRAELERFKAEGLLNNVATADGTDGPEMKANLQLCPMWPHSSFFRAMPFAPKVVEAVSQLIGEPALVHLDQIFLKPGGHGAGTNWHQDNAYFKISDPLKGAALWTAVHEATAANGTMRIIPDAFRESLPHSRDPESNHHVRCYPDESRAITVEMPAGGALFFAYGTPHATGANTTASERAGVALHFINEAVSQEAVGGFEPGERPWLSGPRAGTTERGAQPDGEERAWFVSSPGAWESEVQRMLRSEYAQGL